MNLFSKNLRLIRERLKLKQDAFEKIGIKKGTFSNYENGKTEPNLETLISISKFLGIDLNSLVCIDLSTEDNTFFKYKPTDRFSSSDFNPSMCTEELEILKKIKTGEENAHLNAHLNAHPSQNINVDSTKSNKKEKEDSSLNHLVESLIEQLKEQSEEIGALKQENFMLKHRLEEIADSAPDVNTAHG